MTERGFMKIGIVAICCLLLGCPKHIPPERITLDHSIIEIHTIPVINNLDYTNGGNMQKALVDWQARNPHSQIQQVIYIDWELVLIVEQLDIPLISIIEEDND